MVSTTNMIIPQLQISTGYKLKITKAVIYKGIALMIKKFRGHVNHCSDFLPQIISIIILRELSA